MTLEDLAFPPTVQDDLRVLTQRPALCDDGGGCATPFCPCANGSSRQPRSITLTLPYPISANRYWNSFPLGKRIMTAPSAEAKKYKRDVAAIARASGVRAPIRGRVQIDIKLYPKRPQDWQARQRKAGVAWDDTVQCLDLDNARKVVYDSLNGVVIEDDKWVRRDTGERMEPDADGPRLVVVVTELMPEDGQGVLL